MTIEHVPVVGQPSTHAEERAILIFDTETGRKIGHSPHVKVEQTKYSKRGGTITTTLKITHVKDAQ
jgi:hypothetical protein